ncbi:MAG: hypothetical protein ABMA13_18085 [Chthoniobacteraceae bacterium]
MTPTSTTNGQKPAPTSELRAALLDALDARQSWLEANKEKTIERAKIILDLIDDFKKKHGLADD